MLINRKNTVFTQICIKKQKPVNTQIMTWLLLFLFTILLLFTPKKLEVYTEKGTEWFVYILLPFRIRLISAGIGIKENLPYLDAKIMGKKLKTDIKSIFKKKNKENSFPYGIIKAFKLTELISTLYTGEADKTAMLCGAFSIVFMNFNAKFKPAFGSEKPFLFLKCIICVNPVKILIELIKIKRRNKNASNRKHTSNHNVTA